MSKLIDWDALVDSIYEQPEEEPRKRVIQIIDALIKAPAVEVEPVRHGRWIPLWKSLFGINGFRCSECGHIEKEAGYVYCHCGAKMDK